MRATTKDQLLWEQRIKDRTKSGMSVSEWCKINEISRSNFHYWNQKLSKKQRADNEMSFAEITPILLAAEEVVPIPEKADDFQMFFKNIQLIVPSNFNQRSLAGLMKVLQEL